MIRYLQCDVLDTYAAIVAHQVNCMGVMGSGVASKVKRKYPHAYEMYKELCDANSHYRVGLLGTVQCCPVSVNPDGTPRIYVANMFGQLDYGRSKYKVYTDYAALRQCFHTLAEFATKHNKVIAMPFKIGCVRGNGNWENVVFPMIQKYFQDNEVLLCDYGVNDKS